jgi:chromosomal replication initiation ATPase DnaA
MGHVIRVVANYFAVTDVDITKRVKGLQKENEARKLAMYFCQELVAAKLTDIAARFHLSHVGSIRLSSLTSKLHHCLTST